jgi:hypothetical protein
MPGRATLRSSLIRSYVSAGEPHGQWTSGCRSMRLRFDRDAASVEMRNFTARSSKVRVPHLATAWASVSYVTVGRGPVGAHAAVLNTAHFSGLVFALALVARGFATQRGGWGRWLGDRYVALQIAFVGAYFVHFSAVFLLAWLDASHPLHRLQSAMLAVTVFGFFLLISLIGLTASARPDQKARRRLNRSTFYLAWVLFVLALGAGASTRPLAAVMRGVLSGAMAIRITVGMATRKRHVLTPPPNPATCAFQ